MDAAKSLWRRYVADGEYVKLLIHEDYSQSPANGLFRK